MESEKSILDFREISEDEENKDKGIIRGDFSFNKIKILI